MMRMRRRPRVRIVRSRFLPVLLWLCGLVILSVLLLSALNNMLSDILDGYVDVRLRAAISQQVSSAVLEEMTVAGDEYTGMVKPITGADGHVTAIETDAIKLNMFKSRIRVNIQNKLDAMSASNINVPIGTLLGGKLLTGRGPGLVIRIIPVGAADAKLVSSFESAGINQTIHRIIVEVDISATIIMPGAAVMHAQTAQVILGETVIVGNIPGSYTYIDDTRGTTDKLIDYAIN